MGSQFAVNFAGQRPRGPAEFPQTEWPSGWVTTAGAVASAPPACLELGLLDDAERLAMRSAAPALTRVDFVPYGQTLLGDIRIHPDRFDPERGEAHYRQALALAQPRGMRTLVAHCHRGLGILYSRVGKREQARELLGSAATMYRGMDMGFWLTQADSELTNLD